MFSLNLTGITTRNLESVMLRYPEYFAHLISALRKLPGIGMKSAEKMAFELMSWSECSLDQLNSAIQQSKEQRVFCSECRLMTDTNHNPCEICSNRYQSSQLCIVSSCKDVFALEKSKTFTGTYFVLGNLLSPVTGQQIEAHVLQHLERVIEQRKIQEVVFAFEATLEGDATALFLKKTISSYHVQCFRLALGMPIGLSFEFVDSLTLANAFKGRQPY